MTTKLSSFPDVATEKTHKALVEGVEAFDSSKLKHTETQEKNLLPDKDGNIFFILLLQKCRLHF